MRFIFVAEGRAVLHRKQRSRNIGPSGLSYLHRTNDPLPGILIGREVTLKRSFDAHLLPFLRICKPAPTYVSIRRIKDEEFSPPRYFYGFVACFDVLRNKLVTDPDRTCITFATVDHATAISDLSGFDCPGLLDEINDEQRTISKHNENGAWNSSSPVI